MHAMYLMIAVLVVLAIAYRFYSAFLAAKVLALDDANPTPAQRLNDGQNYHPTNKWVLFGHHFAAISGAGPLLGPVLAVQFGYMPGLLWILIGVCLAGAVQDFVVLTLSIRRNGKSLAQIAYEEIGQIGGGAATFGILFVLVIALAGLGKAVVKALGGEEVKFPTGTVFMPPEFGTMAATQELERTDTLPSGKLYRVGKGVKIIYPSKSGPAVQEVAQPFDLEVRAAAHKYDASSAEVRAKKVGLPRETPGVALLINDTTTARLKIAGSTWGTFSIAMTIPIAFFTGWWMYRARKGHVLEASIIGGVLTLGAVYLGSWLGEGRPLETLREHFNLSESGITWAMAIYGFIASVLPVWLLLCPRDYLSSFLKIGTLVVLVLGVIIANPVLQAPAVNQVFLTGGPTVKGSIFPFVFITIMCGAISGFHSLVSSGTTPKMISRETHARAIGYGAMLIEGLVGIVALIAAASLPTSHYYQMNTSWKDLPQYQQQIVELAAKDTPRHSFAQVEQQVGETLQGRTGGAVTLAVGMAEIFDQAARNLLGLPPGAPGQPPVGQRIDGAAQSLLAKVERLIPYWYHFAIMFEALFILTTIDTGTRVGRFLLQETLGKWVHRKFAQTDWWPGAILATALIVGGWFYFISHNSMAAIWPMFGIANQMLAVWALAVASAALVRSGKARYVWVTLLPMIAVTITTTTAAVLMVTEYLRVLRGPKWTMDSTNAAISATLIVAIVACTVLIVIGAIKRMGERREVVAGVSVGNSE